MQESALTIFFLHKILDGGVTPWPGEDGRETAECTREARKGDARAELPALLTSLSASQRGGTAMQIKFFQDFLNTKLIPDEKYVSDRCEALATIHEKFKVCIGNYNRCGC